MKKNKSARMVLLLAAAIGVSFIMGCALSGVGSTANQFDRRCGPLWYSQRDFQRGDGPRDDDRGELYTGRRWSRGRNCRL